MRTIFNKHSVLFALTMFLVGCSTPSVLPPSEPDKGELVRRGVNIAKSEILFSVGTLGQIEVRLQGTLPTPCHTLQWEKSVSEDQGLIRIEVYSLVDPEEVCIEIEEPFEISIPFDRLSTRSYQVWVNGQLIGTLDVGGQTPTSKRGDFDRGSVYIDESDILLLESYPVQVMLSLKGNLPTPCDQLEWEVSKPDDSGRILVEVYSTSKAEGMCIQVLEPFEVRIPLGNFTEGFFSVWLNGARIGEFNL